MFGKAKVVVQTDRFIYFEDGKIEPKKRLLGKYVIIEVLKGEGYSKAEKKPSSRIKYVFEVKENGKKVYYYTAQLNTEFLRFVVKKLKGVENFLLKISPNLGILFFGDETVVITAENENDLIEKAKNVAQGAEIEVVDFNEIYPQIVNKAKNPAPFIVIALILGALGYFVYDNYLKTEPPPPPPPPAALQPLPQAAAQKPKKIKSLPYELSVLFLQSVASLDLPLYLFVSDVDFTTLAFHVGSFVPLPEFKKRGFYYVNAVVARKKLEEVLKKYHESGENYLFSSVVRNYDECLSYMNSNFPIEKVGKNYVSYVVGGSKSVDEVAEMLHRLKNCPVKVEGSISFEDLMHRSLSLKIYLYSPSFLASIRGR